MDSTALEPPPPQRIIPVWNQVGKDKPIEWNRGCTRNDDLLFRFRSLVANTLVADMSFHVEQDDVLIPAHRLIVGMASPHLKELLYLDSTPPVGSSDTADNISSPIIIPVRFCSAKSFHQVSERNIYIYAYIYVYLEYYECLAIFSSSQNHQHYMNNACYSDEKINKYFRNNIPGS